MRILILLTIVLFNSNLLCQESNRFYKVKNKIEIPFNYTNGLIEVKVKINKIPLNFIFDTGAEHTIITNKDIVPLLNTVVTKEISVYGADFSNEIKAFITVPVDIQLYKTNRNKNKYYKTEDKNGTTIRFNISEPKSYASKKEPIIILSKDIFSSENNKSRFQGILGASFFSNSFLKIDYRRKVLVLYPYNYKMSMKGYKEIPVEFKGHKPIIKTQLKINNQDTVVDARVLMDTGSSIPLLFLENIDSKFKLPTKTIIGQLGLGLGGNLMGYIGLVYEMKIGDFKFKSQISKFQKVDSIPTHTINFTRDGILGNDILKRFTIIIDNFRKKLYFKPNKEYYRPIKYDKSGITLYASGKSNNKYFIKYIIPNSPSDIIGLKPNDQIISAQYFNYRFWSLRRMLNLFKKKEGKKIRLKIKRGNKKIIFNFKLKDMLH